MSCPRSYRYNIAQTCLEQFKRQPDTAREPKHRQYYQMQLASRMLAALPNMRQCRRARIAKLQRYEHRARTGH